MRSSQFTLARMLASVVAIAAAFAFWRWLDGLGAVIGVLGLMILAMSSQGRHRILFTSSDGVSWLGGALMTLSGFFTYVIGPWGAELAQYGFIDNIGWSWNGLGWMTMLWPMAFGAITVFQGFLGLSFGDGINVSRLRWAISVVFLAGIAIAHLAVFFKFILPVDQTLDVLSYFHYLGFPAAVLTATAASVVFCPNPLRKYAVLQALAAFCILLSLYPVSSWVPIGSVLTAYGVGYWMLLVGVLMILGVNVRIGIASQSRSDDSIGDTLI